MAYLLDTNHCFLLIARDARLAALAEYGPRERARRRSFDLARLGFTDNDLWIAAGAIEHDAILVSDDGRLPPDGRCEQSQSRDVASMS